MFYPFSSGQEDIVKDGLVLWLDAGDRTSYPGGGNSWRDLTPNANNGTLTNGPTFDNLNGGSIVFDGTNDYIRIPDSPELQFGLGSFTAFAWVYPSGTNNVRIINNRGTGTPGSSSGYQFKLFQDGSNWYFGDCAIDEGVSVGFRYDSSNKYPLNNWYYINMVYETQNELKFYVNRVLDGTVTVGTYGSLTNSLPTAIGAAISNTGTEGGYSQFYNGKIPIAGLYNRALSANEISQNFNATRSRFGV